MRTRPPGPQNLPVVGATPYYARDPFRFMSALRDAYGDVATFRLGRQQTFMVTRPETIERVLVRESDVFGKPKFQTDAMEELLGTGLLLSEGEFWREMRQLTQPAFAPGRIAGLVGMMAERAGGRIARWRPGEVRDVETEMARIAVDVIVDAMLGTELSDARIRRVQESLEPLGRRFEPDAKRALLPDWLPTPEDRRYRNAVGELEDVIADIVAERQRADGDSDDLLAILLRARHDGQIDDDQIRDEAMTMLLAGHDTTALSLTYAWYLLSGHPEAERKLHDELDETLDGPPTIGDVRELEYARWIINESMRLYPPVYALFRQAGRDVELLGHDVPAGSLVMLPQWAVHRDPRYFDDPESFQPERWESPDHPSFAYFPFGAGPRSCIGKRFSLIEATAVLAVIASRYRLRRIDDRPLDLHGSLTMHPADGMKMRVEER